MARLVRLYILLALAGSALLLPAMARAECGGIRNCIAVSFGDVRPAHGTPLTSAPLAFGEQRAGTTSATRTVRVGAVQGPAGTRATLNAITLTGANAGDFEIASTSCTIGSPSLLHDGTGRAQLANTCTILLAFRPSTPGGKTAALLVRSSAITRTVPLAGTATPSETGPVAAPASLATQVNTPATLDLAPFITGTATGIGIVAAPSHGSVVVEGTRVTYTPARDYFGPDAFSYAAFNNAGSSAPAPVSVNVGGRPDPTRDPNVAGLLAAQSRSARRFAGAQIANYQQRLESLRGAGGGAAQARPAGPGSAALHAALAGTAAAGSGGSPEDGTGPWLAGGFSFGTEDERANRPRSRFTSEGVTVGIDRRFGQGLVLGAGIGFAQDDTDIGASGTRSRSRGVSTGIYGSSQAENSFVDGILGYGQLRHDSDRFVPAAADFASVRGRRSHQLFGSVAAGYLLHRDTTLLSPYGRLDVSVDRFDEATESGAGANALTYFGHTQRTLQLAAGVRAEGRHQTSFGMAMPRLRLELRHAFEGGRDPSLAFADLRGGTIYTYSPPDEGRTSLLLGVGSDFALRNGLTLGLDYVLERATGGARSHGVRAFLRQDLDARGGAGAPASWQGLRDPLQVDAGYMWDDNLSRAGDAADRRSDHVYSLGVSRSTVVPLTDHLQAVLAAFLEGDKPYTYDGLDRLALGVRGELQYRPSAAFNAPTFGLFIRALHDEYQSALRTGERYAYGLSVRQSWTDRIDAFAALDAQRRHARGDVFDTRDWGLRFHLDYAAGPGVAYASAEYRRGDSVSSGGGGAGSYAFIAEASAPDDAFPGFTAYRLDARTVIWTLGYNLPLGTRDSLDLSWRRVDATGFLPASASGIYPGAPRYRVNQLLLVYLLRF